MCHFLEQRNKELSYTLRLCHLHPTNGDGSQAITFGFELSEDPDFEYPLILRVEPQSPAEVAGLQSRDILLKINERKTKGLGYEKVKKEIEKAKREGRLEMLVVDQETFDYCKRTKKPMKEPEMKVKHIFPKSRSSASFHKVPSLVSVSQSLSKDNPEKMSDPGIIDTADVPFFHVPLSSASASGGMYHLGSSHENESDHDEDEKDEAQNVSDIRSQVKMTPSAQGSTNADFSSSRNRIAANFSAPAPSPVSKSSDFVPSTSSTQRTATASGRGESGSSAPKTASSLPSASESASATPRGTSKETKSSKSKVLPNAINHLFHKIGHSKSSKRS